MKTLFVYLFCLITTFVFSITVVQGYSPPNLANAAYTNGPFVTTPHLVGQCTWYCYGRIQEVGLISSNQLASTSIFRGNASNWVADAVAAGFSTNSTPQVGALAVWNTAGLDHVAFVETVSGSTITVTECNNKPAPGANVVVGGASNLRSTMDSSSSGNILWTMPEFTAMYVLGGPFTTNINSYPHRSDSVQASRALPRGPGKNDSGLRGAFQPEHRAICSRCRSPAACAGRAGS